MAIAARPAKNHRPIHQPIILEEHERTARHDDKSYQARNNGSSGDSINRSLIPALRGAIRWSAGITSRRQIFAAMNGLR